MQTIDYAWNIFPDNLSSSRAENFSGTFPLLHRTSNIAPVESLPELDREKIVMGKKRADGSQIAILQGTLDTLILQTLVTGPAHGHTIAHLIQQRSEDILQVEHGSLYPALHRLENRGWIASFWGTSENNRKARYYRLTTTGRSQLHTETSRWDLIVRAVNRVLRPAEE